MISDAPQSITILENASAFLQVRGFSALRELYHWILELNLTLSAYLYSPSLFGGLGSIQRNRWRVMLIITNLSHALIVSTSMELPITVSQFWVQVDQRKKFSKLNNVQRKKDKITRIANMIQLFLVDKLGNNWSLTWSSYW